MFTLAEACNILRVDQGINDTLITSLVSALPAYIEVTTGIPTTTVSTIPLAKTLGQFLLTLWYYGDKVDTTAMYRTISNLETALVSVARDIDI